MRRLCVIVRQKLIKLGNIGRNLLDDLRGGVDLASRTYDGFLLRMRRITIKRARTWRWARMRPWVGRSSGPVSFPPSQSCPGCTTNASGYDFRKGQAVGLLSTAAIGPIW